KTRSLVIAIILACLTFMLLADSRGTFLMVFFAGVLTVLAFHFRMSGFLRVFVITVPVLPFLFVSMMSVVGTSDAAAEMSRTGNADNVATMSARTIIWEECMKEVTKPKPIHLVGWGEHGESPAGVAARYGPLFGSVYPEGYTLIVTHNLFFQLFFDVGYIGMFIFLGALLLAMNNGLFLYKRGYRIGLVYVALILYYVLSGILESNFGNHNRSYNEVLMMTVIAVIALKNEYIRLQKMYEREQEEFF
ncbi:MAG: O-antigen ligase family protein, partial [Bacteroidota bacterium]